MDSEPTQKCPQCGTNLSPDSPAGLCPNCLMRLNLKSETVFSGEQPAAQPPLPPEQIAPHFPQLEILECLGRGGMGVVYKARQKTLNRFVALKLLAPERVNDPKFAERFTREAHALAALNHPNIVTVYDFGQAGGFYYLLMEFVDGVNLRQLLRTRKFSPQEALTIVPPLCDALQFAHERGIVHRDIKPENILLDKSGRVKVADFGIAKMLGPGSGESGEGMLPIGNATQSALGTPGYSAPEQKTSPQNVDSRADIYSLGVVFYEMLTGEMPAGNIEPPSRKVHIDVRLDEVVLRALEKKPELRYQQASVLKTQVETIATTPQAGASAPIAAMTALPGMAGPRPAQAAPTIPPFPVAPASAGSDKIILPAFLLAFFFGVFGAHRFYVGKIGTAFMQLSGLGGCVALIILCALSNNNNVHIIFGTLLGALICGCGIWATIDWIMILCGVFTDGYGRRISRWLHSSPHPPGPPVPPSPPANPIAPIAPLAGSNPPGVNKALIIIPAVGLMAAAVFKLVSAYFGLFVIAGLSGGWLNDMLKGFGIDSTGPLKVAALASLISFKVLPALLVFYGATQMLRLRSHAWAVTAGIAGIFLCSIIGLVMGIWALIVLAQRDVREMFNQPQESMKSNSNIGKIIFATVVVIFLLITVIIPFLANAGSAITNGLSMTNGHWPGAEITENFETNCPLATNGQFSLDNVNGATDVVGGDEDHVVVKAVKHAYSREGLDSLKIDVNSQADSLVIHTHQPKDSDFMGRLLGVDNARDGWVDYTVQVPRGVKLDGVSSVNGRVTISNVNGSIKASTVNGATEVHGARSDLDVSTVNGRVSVDLGVLGADQDVTFTAVNGKIDATLPANADATVTASSINGSIASDFPELTVTKDFPVGRHLKGTLGKGGAGVKATVVNGAIYFHRESGTAMGNN
ncbi:MAG TPA: protein kinase [Verrucomicrobiae bacterium]